MKICRNCGRENADDSVFCSFCSSRFEATAYAPPQPDTDNDPLMGKHFQQPYQESSPSMSMPHNEYPEPPFEPHRPPVCPPPLMHQEIYRPMPTPKASKAKLIVCLVLCIVFGSTPGMIFAIIGLISHKEYNLVAMRGDETAAGDKCEKIRLYNKVAWIFAIVKMSIVALYVVFLILYIMGIIFTSGSGLVYDDGTQLSLYLTGIFC